MFVLKENVPSRDILTHGLRKKKEQREGTYETHCSGERTRDKNINRCCEKFSSACSGRQIDVSAYHVPLTSCDRKHKVHVWVFLVHCRTKKKNYTEKSYRVLNIFRHVRWRKSDTVKFNYWQSLHIPMHLTPYMDCFEQISCLWSMDFLFMGRNWFSVRCYGTVPNGRDKMTSGKNEH